MFGATGYVCDVSVLPPVCVVSVSPSAPNGVPAPRTRTPHRRPHRHPVFFTTMFVLPLVFVHVHVTVSPGATLIRRGTRRLVVVEPGAVVTQHGGERPPAGGAFADRVPATRVRRHVVGLRRHRAPPVGRRAGSARRRRTVCPAPENTNAAPAPAPTPVFLTMMFAFFVFVHVQVTVSPGATLIRCRPRRPGSWWSRRRRTRQW